MNLILGDCLDKMKELEENSVDSIVTDPPYGLSFMGKDWDHGIPGKHFWEEALRVAKPGAYLLAFGGTRTHHRLACAIEDAGWEIRDCISWVYGQGFPKSQNIFNKIGEDSLCLLKDYAQYAVQVSESFLLKSKEEKESIVVAFVQILPEGKKAILMETGKGVGLYVLTDTLLSELEILTNLNMTLLWKKSLEDLWKDMSKFITKIKIEETIDQKIWNLLIGLPIFQKNTLVKKTLQNGLQLPVLNVINILVEEKENMNSIPLVTVQGNATWNPLIKYNGTGTCLKPAFEPIVLARKPLAESTVAGNVLKYGTGGININGCRVPIEKEDDYGRSAANSNGTINAHDGFEGKSFKIQERDGDYASSLGRFPSNFVHDGSEEVLELFPNPHSAGSKKEAGGWDVKSKSMFGIGNDGFGCSRIGDSGSAARFFKKCEFNEEDLCQDLNSNQSNVNTVEKSLFQSSLVEDFVLNLVVIEEAQGDNPLKNMIQPFMNEMRKQLKMSEKIDMKMMKSIGQKCEQELRHTIMEMLNENPVNYVGIQLLISTTKIIQNLMNIDGFVENVISNFMLKKRVLGEKDFARFNYCAKASNRDEGLENIEATKRIARGNNQGVRYCVDCGITDNGTTDHSSCSGNFEYRLAAPMKNNHPCVKPENLCRYLCRLITPPNGIILDPFMGSGSTGKAAMLEGFDFIGIEKEEEYLKIAEKRIEHAKKQKEQENTDIFSM
jgi:DNA modification methylase